MATARRNLLAGRLAEHLVCAELTRLELIATTFTHNVPTYDVLATDGECRTVPIQVKATRDKYWRSPATNWMHINMDEKEQIQRIDGQKQLSPLDPIWICVAVGLTRMDDQFFILTQDDIQVKGPGTGRQSIAGGEYMTSLNLKTNGKQSKIV